MPCASTMQSTYLNSAPTQVNYLINILTVCKYCDTFEMWQDWFRPLLLPLACLSLSGACPGLKVLRTSVQSVLLCASVWMAGKPPWFYVNDCSCGCFYSSCSDYRASCIDFNYVLYVFPVLGLSQAREISQWPPLVNTSVYSEAIFIVC